MEMNYNINNNGSSRSSTGSSSSNNASTDSSRNLIIRRPRYYPLSSSAYLGPAFNACVTPQNSENLDFIDSPLLPYSRVPSSANDPFIPPAMDSVQLHQLLHHRLPSFASSHVPSSSPLSPIENLETPPSRTPPSRSSVFNTPVKAEEGVLVIDGILVNAGNRARSSSESGSSSSNTLYKTDICRSWEELGTCRYGLKCQFAHGKEELRPTRHPKLKSEICKSFSMTGTCIYGSKCRFVHQAAGPALASVTTADKPQETLSWLRAASENNQPRINDLFNIPSPKKDVDSIAKAEVRSDWPPTPEEEAYIRKVLYGPSTRRRLPVFVEICPE